MKYIRLYEERLKDFEIMTNLDSNFLIEELVKEIEKKDYDLDYIRDLVNYGHFDIDVIWEDRGIEWTFLQKASDLNKWDIVKVLLEEGGADPNEQVSDGYTALHLASRWGRLQVVQALLEHPKTNPNLQDKDGSTALYFASIGNSLQAVQALLEHPETDPNLKSWHDNTALIIVSNLGYSQVVEELLKNPKTDKTITDERGRTAWDVAKPEIRDEFPELNPEVE